MADSETVNGCTWRYTVLSGEAEVTDVSPATGAVTIPPTLGGYRVTSIGQYAFNDCSELKSVTMPNSVTSIGGWAFEGCSGLTSVTIPDSVTSIGRGAFSFCSGLTSVTIGNGVTSIGYRAFYGCRGLTSVAIGSGVTSISSGAFDGCSGLKEVHISDLSAWCRIDFGEDANPLNYADNLYLNGELVTSLAIPDGVTSVGDLFQGCTNLTSVTIPNSVTNIGWYAFSGCSGLTSVTIGSGVKSIGVGAFRGCSGLTSVTIGSGMTSIGGSAFAACSGLTSVTIPDGVTSIGNDTFSGCSGLTSVTVPNSVTNIGWGAFRGCSGLRSVTIGAGVKSIGEYAFEGCSGLTSVAIPNSVTSIGNDTFSGCSGLRSATIGNGVTSIGNDTFSGCSGLTSVTVPNSVTNIGWGAFRGCSGLRSATIGNGVTSIGNSAFYGCSGLKSVTVPDSVKSIGWYAFEGCSGLTSVTIGSGVTSISCGAFDGCSGLWSFAVASDNPRYSSANGLLLAKGGTELVRGINGPVLVPDSVTSISSNAFYGCGGLTSVAIPNSVTNIGYNAFYGCSGLRSATIGSGVTSIGNEAFSGCSGLTSVTIPNSVTNIGYQAFYGCSGLRSATIGSGVTSIGDYAFYGCRGLTSVTIPASVTKIGQRVFYGCANVKSVTFLGNAPACGNGWRDWWYETLPEGCTVYVPRGSTGWYATIPGTWHDRSIRYGKGPSSGGSGGGSSTSTSTALKFAKTAVSVKESAAYVDVTVNRVAKDGRVRVRYATEDGTAEAGEDYEYVEGVLEWADGDRKAKKIRVPLIPDLVAAYDGVPSKTFTVRLEPLGADELDGDERLADVSGGDTCAVTVTETSKANVTVESVYAKKAAKRATVKKDEDVPLWSGSFYGILEEDGGVLTNGAPRIATCSVTVSKGAKPSISAKVKVAGKTYSFSGKGWDADVWGDAYVGQRTLTRTWKRNGVTYVDELVLTFEGAYEYTSDYGAWQRAGGSAELLLNVPDAKGSGVQPDIRYVGGLRRDNSKIQGYLDAAYKFAGYYTVSLSPDTSIGNGYLTLTVDSKGKAKVAGMLADGALKPSVSAAACRVEKDYSSANGWAMFVDVCHSTATVCFGGTLRLYAVEDESNPDGSGVRIVVDSSNLLAWYDDSATGCVSTYGDGECISLAPCGGWYDKVMNLQRYYLDYALSVETADVSEFPTDELPNGYDYVWDASPSGFGLALSGDKVTYDKRKVVKTNRLTDFSQSTNVCNVSVKLARATGLVTGGFSLWSATEDGAKQKEMTGFKAYGVLLLARDPSAPLDERVVAPGFATKKVKTTYVDEKGKKKTVTWPFSTPFNVVAE